MDNPRVGDWMPPPSDHGQNHYVGDNRPDSRRAEADGPLTDHLRAIATDECVHDDADVYAILQAAALLDELRDKAAWWDANRPDAHAFEVADDFRQLLRDHNA